MDLLQEQVVLLTGKVDALHQMIDQINLRIAEVLSGQQACSSQFESNMQFGINPAVSAYSGGIVGSSDVKHKDILTDNAYMNPEKSGAGKEITPEVQIQRLTAQLTAAYNRIAALEEQLLATRTHH
ncbi:hypothetical protein [Almyronema epifaneia]|uniref:Uncharacterized protein n=1 Tax=Almyronema epifaneia S1 TaxID=2991925 RepID=A0ABW6IHQ9_9CYAN